MNASEPSKVGRRAVLGAAVAVPAVAALPSAAYAAPAAAPTAAASGTTRYDAQSPRFALAVLPDTQYLFDHDAADPAPLSATFHWLNKERKDVNVAFVTHLGDVTEHGTHDEIELASKTFEGLDGRIPYSVLGGNHDVSGDDQRGESWYLKAFGPHRYAGMQTFGGASPDGYNTFHVIAAGGREWLVLALDWRLSEAGFAWVQGVLDSHPTLPAILTTHELAYAVGEGAASLSGYGQQLWERLIRGNDQIFLTLNGHFWPPGRTVLQNDAGNDVHVHITNYQDRYYGGAAMIRLYSFDMVRGAVDVETFSPWILDRGSDKRTALQEETIELTSDVDRFSLEIDFDSRFAGFAPVATPAPRPAAAVMPRGTLAYWRFDQSGLSAAGTDGAALPAGVVARDLSGNGNDMVSRFIGTVDSSPAIPGSIAARVTKVTSSAENPPNERAANLNDSESGSKWLVFSQTGWVRYDLDAPVTAVAYALTSANDAAGRDPRDWILQGSNDGSTWTTLDSRTGESFADRYQRRQFPLAAPAAYSSYRLEVTANAGAPLLQLAEWQLSDDLNGPVPAGSSLLTWSQDHADGQPAHASLRFNGGQGPNRGAIFETGVNAPINNEKFLSGFTIETYIKLPEPFVGNHAWMGLLCWSGNNGRDTGYTPFEPSCSMSISPERFLQFVLYPEATPDYNPTHWSHALETGRWRHIAVVNDGKRSTVYVDGSPIARNPAAPARGIHTLGKPFVLGATQSNETFGQGFYGFVGDVRIVGRALRPEDFMTPFGD